VTVHDVTCCGIVGRDVAVTATLPVSPATAAESVDTGVIGYRQPVPWTQERPYVFGDTARARGTIGEKHVIIFQSV